MEACNLIGLPYKSNGRDLSGIDCFGLAYLFHDKKIPSYGDAYEKATDSNSVSNAISISSKEWLKVDLAKSKRGDIIVFNIKGLPVHVGVILDDNHMIHTLAGHNSCRERYTSSKWIRRIEGIYRWQD